MIPWLGPDPVFPPPSRALKEPNGLLCAGGDLEPARLLAAYRTGIFPWYGEGEPLLWWSPDPRMVLVPAEFRISHSLRKRLRKPDYTVRCDTSFEAVMSACAAPRQAAGGTWILPEMRAAYLRLHRLGHAHSVETWIDGQLVGGLYCVALGRAVFGESMFAHASNASKIALAALVCLCRRHGVAFIDCQQNTAHLASLGAAEIPRQAFTQSIAHSQQLAPLDWAFTPADWAQLLGKEGA